jgi:catechol 2,3-dioxygenase-like lactoylglutathione lyase family enzyme
MLDAIGIISSDVAKSLEFYKLLGVEFRKGGDGDHYETTLPNGMRILLDSVAVIQSFEPGYQHPQRGGVVMCFKQSSPKAVDTMYVSITEAGFRGKKAPWNAFWGQRYACVLDPDNNQIDLFAAL